MGSAENIRRNTVFSFLSAVLRLGANMLMFVGIARYYGPMPFGQFTAAHTYMTLLLVLSDFGLDFFVATDVARSSERAGETIRRLLPLKFSFTVLSVVLLLLFAWGSSLSPETRLYMALLSVGIAGSAISTFLFGVFRGYEQLQHETRISFVQNLLLLLALVGLGLAHAPLHYVAVTFVASRLLGAILAIITAFRVLKIRLLPLILGDAGVIFKRVFPYGMNLLFGTLYFYLDTVLLAYWKGDQAVGTYQAVMKLVILVLVIPDVAVSALLPVLSRLHFEDQQKWIWLGRLSARTLLFICLPVSLMLLVYPEQLITLIYGREGFADAVPVMRLFALVLLARFGAADIPALMITTSDRHVVRMWVMIGATVINVVCNAFAIPRYGILGAAVVALLTNLYIAASFVIAARRSRFHLSFWSDRRAWVPFLITVTMGLLLWEVRASTFMLGIGVAVLVCPLLFALWGYTPAERRLMLALPAST